MLVGKWEAGIIRQIRRAITSSEKNPTENEKRGCRKKAVVCPISSFLGGKEEGLTSVHLFRTVSIYTASVGLRGEGPFERAN